jgi:cytochrome P450
MDPKPNERMGTIPGPRGLPLLGNLPQLLPDPLPYLQRQQRRFGNVFHVGFARNQRVVMLLGAAATERALVDPDGAFSNRLGYLGQSAFIGPGAVLFRDGPDHRSLRQSMNGAFKPSALDAYLQTMNAHVGAQVDAWAAASSTPTVAADVRLMSLGVASEVIAGARLDRDARFVNEHFVEMLAAMVSLAPRLPGTAVWRGHRARRRLDAYFRAQIADRRRSDTADLFTEICHAAEGVGLSDDGVTDNMLGMLLASYETSASAIAMMLYLLARHPQWQDTLLAEVKERIGECGDCDREKLDGLEQMEWVLKETLRLHPPLSYFPRRSVRAVEIEGHVVPPNTAVTVAPAFTHRIESIYAQPERFDPLRFSPSRAEDRVHSCAWIPFGKGAHACMGMHFARMEIKVFFVHLLRRLRIELVDETPPSMTYVPVHRPKATLPVRLVAR